MDSFINLLSKIGLNVRYCICVFIIACICSWYGLDGYSKDSYVRELVNYCILILPVHAIIVGLLMVIISNKFRKYIVEEKGYKTDKDGKIEKWNNVYKDLNRVSLNYATNIVTLFMGILIYTIKVCDLSTHENSKSERFFLLIIICFSILFLIFFAKTSKIIITQIYGEINESPK